jgi:hypothetical protein
VNHLLSPELPKPRSVSDIGATTCGVSDEAVTQLIGATFARAPLAGEDLRDARLIAFLLDFDSGRYAVNRLNDLVRISMAPVAKDRLRSISGLSAIRIHRAISHLVDAAVLERPPDTPPGWLQFSTAVVHPIGFSQHVDWPVVLEILVGRGPAISILRAALELMSAPWDWSRLTYELLADRASYSVGMAQRTVSQLMHFGVLERLAHTGRGHDYRLSTWALGRAPAPRPGDTSIQHRVGEPISQLADVSTSAARTAPTMVSVPISMMAVEIGGLVVRVPVGTEIRMTIDPDGEPCYQVGPELKISRRG